MTDDDQKKGDSTAKAEELQTEKLIDHPDEFSEEFSEDFSEEGENTGIWRIEDGQLVQVNTQVDEELENIRRFKEEMEAREKRLLAKKEYLESMRQQVKEKTDERRELFNQASELDKQIFRAEEDTRSLESRVADFRERQGKVSEELRQIEEQYQAETRKRDEMQQKIEADLDKKVREAEAARNELAAKRDILVKQLEELDKQLGAAVKTERGMTSKKERVREAAIERTKAAQEAYDQKRSKITEDLNKIFDISSDADKDYRRANDELGRLKAKRSSIDEKITQVDEDIDRIKTERQDVAEYIPENTVLSYLGSNTPESHALRPAEPMPEEDYPQPPSFEQLTDADIKNRSETRPVLDAPPGEDDYATDHMALTDDDIQSPTDLLYDTEDPFSQGDYIPDEQAARAMTEDPEEIARRRENAERASREFGLTADDINGLLDEKEEDGFLEALGPGLGFSAPEPEDYTPQQMDEIMHRLTQPESIAEAHYDAPPGDEGEDTQEPLVGPDTDVDSMLDGLEMERETGEPAVEEMSAEEPGPPADPEDIPDAEEDDIISIQEDGEEVVLLEEVVEEETRHETQGQISKSSIQILSKELWIPQTEGIIRTAKIEYRKDELSLENEIQYVDTNMFVMMMNSNAYRMLAGIREIDSTPGKPATFTLEQMEKIAEKSDNFSTGWNNLKRMVENLVSTYNPALNDMITDYVTSGGEVDKEELANLEVHTEERHFVCDAYLQDVLKTEILPALLTKAYMTLFEFGQVPDGLDQEKMFRDHIDVDKLIKGLDKARLYLENHPFDADDMMQKGAQCIEYLLTHKQYAIQPAESAKSAQSGD